MLCLSKWVFYIFVLIAYFLSWQPNSEFWKKCERDHRIKCDLREVRQAVPSYKIKKHKTQGKHSTRISHYIITMIGFATQTSPPQPPYRHHCCLLTKLIFLLLKTSSFSLILCYPYLFDLILCSVCLRCLMDVL